VVGVIRINIYPLGYTHVALGQPKSSEAADRLWRLYRVLRPEIEALERAALRAGPRADPAVVGGES